MIARMGLATGAEGCFFPCSMLSRPRTDVFHQIREVLGR
jgi:hypothetical protein